MSTFRRWRDLLTHKSPGTEPLRSHREPPLEREDPAGDATLQARKRRLDAGDPIPAKRARLTQADTQQPGVEDETAEQAKKV
jgi:hypothetical protein